MENQTKKQRSELASKLGSGGGKAVAKKRGKAYMRKIGEAGARKRWGIEPRA